MRKITTILIVFFIFANYGYSQFNLLSISLKGNYTTTSRLYPIYDGSADLYDNYYSVDDIFGYGVEVRKNFISENIFLGVSGEVVSGKIDNQDKSTKLPVKDGYKLFIFDLNCYYVFPLSTETFKVYIGGGTNVAFGKRIREILEYSSENIKSSLNLGIQVSFGLEHHFFNNLLARWEMKFRDPIVDTESKFNVDRIVYRDRVYSLSTKPFKSKINIDGIVFDFSIAYKF